MNLNLKQSNGFKRRLIHDVAKILNMPDTTSLRGWISHYEHGGISPTSS